ncbi:ABC transporter ATP-binding protein [Streptococcus mutans]|nr:ABC transporter ATP-binding protein [Streptococcus mutans]
MSKRYGQQLALDNVNLTIQKGEIYGLIGKNGAGKTTLIKVITKLIQPSQGSVSVFGSSTQSEWTHALKRVGSVIETPVALNHLTARQNLHYYCKARHVPNADKVIDESLTLVGLTNTGKKKFRGFSLGMKQRLGIAIALIVKPDFLILDEPINGLDPVAIKEFWHMIKKLNEEHDMTVIISSHILSELYQVATKFGIIENGRIIKEISKADFDTQSEDYIVLKTSHINEASQILQDQMNYRIKVTNADNEIHVFGQSHSIKGIVKELVANAVDIDEIYYKRQDLEDYFTQIVE